MKKVNLLTGILLAVLAFSACNFGDELPTPSGNYVVVSNEDARPLPADFTTRKAISYSGYREGQEPGITYPSESQILEDLNILKSLGFTLLRLYDSGEHAKRVLNVIKTNNLEIKVMLGVWISGSREIYNGKNTAECDRAVAWATGEYIDQIVAVSVGNECMVDWNTFGWATPPADIAYYVSYVREQITQPVTVDDNWEPWSLQNEQGTAAYADVYMVAEAVDFIALHTYAIADAEWGLWDYKQTAIAETFRADAMMNAAIDFAKANYNAAKDALANIGINKPIIIGETGWKSKGDAMGIAHPVNQQMYYEKLDAWVGTAGAPPTSFYFEAFDEPWKGGDDNWGYFNVDRKAKYIIYSNATWDALGYPIEDTDEWTPADAVIYIEPEPPITITDNVFYVFADDVTSVSGYDGQTWDKNRDTSDGQEAVNFKWEAWENNSTAGTDLTVSTANSQDTEPTGADTVAVITPDPETWGWGMMALLTRQGFDLSGFEVTGSLKFRIKTSYSDTLEVGIQTGYGADKDSMDLLIEIDHDDIASPYYVAGPDVNNWYDISIPISTLVNAAEPSFGNDDPGTVKLEKVYIPFVIADTNGTFETTEIWVDQIRWEK